VIDYSSPLKWMSQFRRKGDVQPKRQEGLSSEYFVTAYGMAA